MSPISLTATSSHNACGVVWGGEKPPATRLAMQPYVRDYFYEVSPASLRNL